MNESSISTRKAYGEAVTLLGRHNPDVVVLDAETSNSTFTELFKNEFPQRYIECFIAEQNMVSMALGLSKRGKIPFVSTFAAFFTRAFDQIRMTQDAGSNIKFIGSHAGVSIGEDGSSLMALEDIAMFRSISTMTVLYPSDGTATHQLVNLAAEQSGNVYIRTTRGTTPLLYEPHTPFRIGGSHTLRSSNNDAVTLISAGITLHEALKAHDQLLTSGIRSRVIDLYSVKPIDIETLITAAAETRHLIVIEDHHPEGGIGEAVCSALAQAQASVHLMAVTKQPRSGTPEELLAYEELDSHSITAKVLVILSQK